MMPEWTRTVTHDVVSTFAGVGFYEWRLRDDCVTWSPGLLEIFGIRAAPASEQEFTALVHPEDRVRVEAETSTFLGVGDTYAHEFRIVRPDGGVRYIHDRGAIERDEAGRAVLLRGINLDITEQARARGTRWQSVEGRRREQVPDAPFGVYDLDVAAERTHWSPSLLRIVGRDGAHVPVEHRQALDGLHPEDRPRAEAEMSEAIRQVGVYELTYRIRRPDGGVVHVLDRGETFGPIDAATGRASRAIGIVEDVTRARQLERMSRENEERLELAYSVSGIAAFDIDLETNVSHWSPNLYALLGLTGDEPASPELFLAHVHHEDVARVRASYEASISDKTLFKEEFRIIRADGELRYLKGTGRVVELADGVPVRMIGVNYDITDRKMAEERRQLLVREINHREKNLLALVQAIARQTSHDTHAEYLDKFSDRLRSLSASQSLLIEEEWSGLDVRSVARSQLDHFSDLIGSRLLIEGPPLSVAPAVGQTIGMALHELATNAAKYGALTVPSGCVRLTWRCYSSPAGERRFAMSWQESGGPKVRPPERTGFGTVILERMLTSTLAAHVTLAYPPGGVEWRLDCLEAALHVGQDQ